MNVFELIKTVLDDAYSEIAGDAAEKDAEIKLRLDNLRDAFGDLTDDDRPAPDYGSATSRFAYVYKYTTCHANIVAAKCAQVPELSDLLARDGWIDVACVGGGPGSDFLGVVKHKIRAGCAGNLKCYLLDKEPAWGDSWADVDRRTDDLKFRVSTHSQVLDVTDPATWKEQTRYLSADLFTLIYFVSEIWRVRDDAADCFAHILKTAKPGSLFLFVDNGHSDFYGLFDSLAEGAGLEKLAGGEERFQLEHSGRWAEEKSDLEPYFSKFTKVGHSPKMTTNISWRVYRKPA